MDAKNEKERKKESATNEQHPNEKPDHVKKSVLQIFKTKYILPVFVRLSIQELVDIMLF